MHVKSHPFLLIHWGWLVTLIFAHANLTSPVVCFLYSGFEMEYITWLQSPTETAVWPSLGNEIPITVAQKMRDFTAKSSKNDSKHSNFSQYPPKKSNFSKNAKWSFPPKIKKKKQTNKHHPPPTTNPAPPHLPRITPPTTVCPSPLGVREEVSPMTTSSRGDAAAAPESQGQTSWWLQLFWLGKKALGKIRDSYSYNKMSIVISYSYI